VLLIAVSSQLKSRALRQHVLGTARLTSVLLLAAPTYRMIVFLRSIFVNQLAVLDMAVNVFLTATTLPFHNLLVLLHSFRKIVSGIRQQVNVFLVANHTAQDKSKTAHQIVVSSLAETALILAAIF
jgi:hypothetical protein